MIRLDNDACVLSINNTNDRQKTVFLIAQLQMYIGCTKRDGFCVSVQWHAIK